MDVAAEFLPAHSALVSAAIFFGERRGFIATAFSLTGVELPGTIGCVGRPSPVGLGYPSGMIPTDWVRCFERVMANGIGLHHWPLRKEAMEPGAWSLNRKSFIWIDHEAAETTKPVIFPIEEGVMGSVSLIEGGEGRRTHSKGSVARSDSTGGMEARSLLETALFECVVRMPPS